MLTQAQFGEILYELETAQRPLFFFHDDADGVCSFLLLYRHVMRGKGIMVKAVPVVDDKYIRQVEEYSPDKIFILDLAIVEQSFIDKTGIPIVWVDHHEPLQREGVKYFNPMLSKEKSNTSVTELCYNVVKKDIWIAAVGSVSDWQIPRFIKEFSEQYPKLLDAKVKKPEDALFNSGVGHLARIMNFILKGSTSDAMRAVKVISRIDDPYEILDQKSPRGRFIMKKFMTINEHYEKLLKTALKSVKKGNMLLFEYKEAKFSFTGELANELLYRYPSKAILLCREKSGEMRCSLRSAGIAILPVLKKSLEGVDGMGGGHQNACGCSVKVKDFPKFIEQFKKAL